MSLKLRLYQEKAYDFLIRRRRAVLGSELRTGKTPVAIKSADYIYGRTPQDGKFLNQIWVICPANVKYTFAEQIADWSEYQTIQVIDEGQEKINYQKVWIVMSYAMAIKKLAELTDKTPPTVVILDEAHHVKNFKAKRTQATIGKDSILRNARAVWLLTGTPFPNNLIDCYALFNFCLYGKLGKYWDFAGKYCYIKEGYFGKKAVGCQRGNLPVLVEQVKTILHRDTLEMVWKEMPKRQDIIITLPEKVRPKQDNSSSALRQRK